MIPRVIQGIFSCLCLLNFHIVVGKFLYSIGNNTFKYVVVVIRICVYVTLAYHKCLCVLVLIKIY